jgi:hypothetical protein
VKFEGKDAKFALKEKKSDFDKKNHHHPSRQLDGVPAL